MQVCRQLCMCVRAFFIAAFIKLVPVWFLSWSLLGISSYTGVKACKGKVYLGTHTSVHICLLFLCWTKQVVAGRVWSLMIDLKAETNTASWDRFLFTFRWGFLLAPKNQFQMRCSKISTVELSRNSLASLVRCHKGSAHKACGLFFFCCCLFAVAFA